eukprot:12054593-Alexandrium_andersonii.AAC.1
MRRRTPCTCAAARCPAPNDRRQHDDFATDCAGASSEQCSHVRRCGRSGRSCDPHHTTAVQRRDGRG